MTLRRETITGLSASNRGTASRALTAAPPVSFWRRETIAVVFVMLASCLILPSARTQEPAATEAAEEAKEGEKAAAKPQVPPKPVPLYEQKPYDIVILDEENKRAQLKVYPIPFPGRRLPVNPRPDSKITIQMLDQDDEEYEIAWRNITKVALFEELLLREGNRLVDESLTPVNGQPKTPEQKAKLLEEAFLCFYRLRESSPDWPGLKESLDRYLFYDAANLNSQKKFAESFSVIEELYKRNPKFRLTETSPTIADVMSRVLSNILNTYFEQKDYLGMRTLINGMTEKYGAQKPAAVDAWAAQLAQLAAVKRDEGRTLLTAQKFREAIAAVKEMNNIWPDVEGGKQLDAELSAAYPIIFVGVAQPALEHDAQKLDNWSARRTGRLVNRTLVEFLRAGPEGGEYQFAMGSIDHSDDRRRLFLRVQQPSGSDKNPVTGHDVARRLLEIATPGAPDYSTGWASLITGVSVKNVYSVEVDLKRPHVLPEALLRVPFVPRPADSDPALEGDGAFRVQFRDVNEVQYANKSFAPGSRLAEIVERTFTETQKGLGALRRGEIDVLDRLFPADAIRMRAEASVNSPIKVEAYSVPTVHVLVPNLKNPFLADRDFRRAVLLGINREAILHDELMGGRNYPGFQVISGPFPARVNESDPLGYAYDESTRPMAYSPLLARVVTIVTNTKLAELAKKNKEPAPKLSKLILGYPGHEMPRIACQAIATQLKLIGLEVELREFPPGVFDDPKGDCDLVYKEIAIWEPVTDARRILDATGVAPTQSPYVLQSLRMLDMAENWGDVRDGLIDIHRAVYSDVALLPLWQTVDFFAYQTRLKNVGANPVWIYQNVDQWRIGVETGAE